MLMTTRILIDVRTTKNLFFLHIFIPRQLQIALNNDKHRSNSHNHQSTLKMTNTKNFAIVTTVAFLATTADSFGVCSLNNAVSTSSHTRLSAEADNRRNFLRSAAGLAFGAAALTSNDEPASATYSAYTAREKDWEERQKNGGKLALEQIGMF